MNGLEPLQKPPLLTVSIDSMSYVDGDPIIIDRLETHLRESEVLALLGPSGSGKTTLLRVVAGLEHGFQGSVELEGRKVSLPGPEIQIVFQDYRLLPWLNVRENVQLALLGGNHNRADQVLNDVGLDGLAFRWPKHLSGGETARVALARVLMNPPKVLLLDEPFKSLDIATKSKVVDEWVTMAKEKGIASILVTHDAVEAASVADRVLIVSGPPLTVKTELTPLDKPIRERSSSAVLQTVRAIYDTLLKGSERSVAI
jgi:ABC-type nitrate/sulfonate/bicarbonate transport system ATPase subunit